jgi:hypothetical protein
VDPGVPLELLHHLTLDLLVGPGHRLGGHDDRPFRCDSELLSKNGCTKPLDTPSTRSSAGLG